MKKSIGFAEGFMGPKRNDGVLHEYDHEKACDMVKEAIKNDPDIASVYAGLDGDWDQNNDLLWDGKFHKPDFYSGLIWAKPSLLFVYKDGKEKYGGYCYTDQPILQRPIDF